MRELDPTGLQSANTLDLDDDVFLISFKLIVKHQLDVTGNKNNIISNLCLEPVGNTKYKLYLVNNLIYLSVSLLNCVINWYHTYLHHPAITNTHETIHTHFTNPSLCSRVKELLKPRKQCLCKRLLRHYGKLPIAQYTNTRW